MRIVIGILSLLVLALPALAQGDSSGPRLDAVCVLDRKTGRAVYFPVAYLSYMDRSRWTQVSASSDEGTICWRSGYRAPLVSVNEIFSGDRTRPAVNVDRTRPAVNVDRTRSEFSGDRPTSEVERARSVVDVNGVQSVADVNGGQPGQESGDALFLVAPALMECIPRHAAAPVRLCSSHGRWRLMYASAGSAVEGPLLVSRRGSGTNPVSGQPWAYEYVAVTPALPLTTALILTTAYPDGKPYQFIVYYNGRTECEPDHAAAPIRLCESKGQWRLMYASADSAVEGPLLVSRRGSGTNPVSGQPWAYEYVAATSTLSLTTAQPDGKPFKFVVYFDGRVDVEITAW